MAANRFEMMYPHQGNVDWTPYIVAMPMMKESSRTMPYHQLGTSLYPFCIINLQICQ